MKRFFTEHSKEITANIRNGNTVLFTSIIEAEKYARQIRSYHYQVYNIDRQHEGWGVPK